MELTSWLVQVLVFQPQAGPVAKLVQAFVGMVKAPSLIAQAPLFKSTHFLKIEI